MAALCVCGQLSKDGEQTRRRCGHESFFQRHLCKKFVLEKDRHSIGNPRTEGNCFLFEEVTDS